MSTTTMSHLVLKILLLLTTSTAISVEAFSSTTTGQQIIMIQRSYHISSHLHLFSRSKVQTESADNGDNNGKSSSMRGRGGVLRKDVKKLDWLSGGKQYDRNAAAEASLSDDRHAWKKKNRNYPGGDRELPEYQKSLVYRWRGIKQKIRYLFYRNTVYVLECEGNKYYVGSTRDRKRRYREHFENSRGGSKWTRMHKPIRVIAEYKRIPSRYLMGMESQKTADYMIKFGVNNVRGGSYCFARNFTTADLSDLTSFLGHYKQLDYKELSQELKKVLPRADPSSSSFPPPPRDSFRPRNKRSLNNSNGGASPKSTNNGENNGENTNEASSDRKYKNYKNKLRRKQRIQNKDKAKCYKCGQIGHWASECSNTENKETGLSSFKNRMDSTAATSFDDPADQWFLQDDA